MQTRESDLGRLHTFSRLIQKPRHRLIVALLFSVVLVLSVFPDVAFRGTTLSITGQAYGLQNGLRCITLFRQPLHRVWWHGYSDPGGAMWQSDPMLHFMRFCINGWESPYWNPYSGAGQLGPETLVDLKFAFQTAVVTLLGGTETVFSFFTLFQYTLAIFCLFLVLNRKFRLSAVATALGCVVFLLNGYNMTNLCTNTSPVYIYFPVLLLLLCNFREGPNATRFALLTAVFAVALSTTFLPICLLVLLSTFAIACGYTWATTNFAGNIVDRLRSAFIIASLQAAAAVTGMLSLSFLYFPIVESFQVIDPISMYNSRIFYPANINSILSFFTPKHFWEEYPDFARLTMKLEMTQKFILTNVVFHFGIAPSLLAGASLSFLPQRFRPVLWSASIILILAVGRIFAIPIIYDFVGILPGLKSIGEQYWFSAIAVAFPILVAFGVDAIGNALTDRRLFVITPVICVASIIVASAFYLNNVYGLSGNHADLNKFYLSCSAMILAISFVVIVVTLYLPSSARHWSLIALAIICFFELDTDAVHARYPRSDQFLRPSPEIAFLKQNVGTHRVATIGTWGLPPEFGSAYQIQQIESLNMNVLPKYQDLFKQKFLQDPSARWGIFPSLQKPGLKPPMNMPMLSLLGVKYVVVPNLFTPWIEYFDKILKLPKAFAAESISIYENQAACPKAFAVTRIIKGKGTPDDFNAQPNQAACTTDDALLREAERIGINTNPLQADAERIGNANPPPPEAEHLGTTPPAPPPPAVPPASVQILTYHNASIDLTTNVPHPSLLVLMDNWHPNWKCEIDGKPAYIGLVNESFRGVVLPAGRHSALFHYRPATLTAGLTLSAFVWTALLALVAFNKKLMALASRVQNRQGKNAQ